MKLLRLLTNWLHRKPFSCRPSQRPRVLLQVEHLEDRLAPAVTDLLPDLMPWASQSAGYLYGWYLDNSTMPGHTLLRLSNAVVNRGAGALELRGGATNSDGTQIVYQRIFQQGGGYRNVLAGSFIYHSAHNHIHFEDFAQYNLRAVTTGNGVGAIVAAGDKTSFALLDTTIYDRSLPGFPANPRYKTAGQVQGISVGWADVYKANLPGQYIDITGVAPGTYWLESVTDPANRILESNETNNVTRIMITLGTAGQPDSAGNTLAAARDIGTLTSSQIFHDFVEPADTNDYYRFSLAGSTSFTLRLDNLSADADVRLLNSAGSTITSSTRSGTSPETISRTLTAGTYYVRVFPYNGANTAYTLTLGSGAGSADGAGNSLGTARDLGGLSGTQSFSDYVGSADSNDYYRFLAGSGTAFTLRLDELSANADVQLLDENGDVVASSTQSGTSAETINQTLELGHFYYVRVFPSGSAGTNYRLSLTLTQASDDTLATARNIGELSVSQAFQDHVGAGDVNDYYRFTLTSRADFSLLLNGLSADADVHLLNSAGATITSSTRSGTSAETISRTLDAGTYYVRVFPYQGATTNYTLNLSAVLGPADGAGGTLATARDIGTLSGNQTYQDYVGSSDTNDYYRFALSSLSNFSLLLNGLSADADVHLLNSAGTVLTSSTRSGTTAETISRTLAAGIYYVRVFPYQGATTNYTLSLTATAT